MEKRADEERLAGAHIAGDDDEALRLFDAVTQVRQRPLVPAAAEVEARIGRQAERLGVELVVLLVHVRNTS